jgi:hypothetical protein
MRRGLPRSTVQPMPTVFEGGPYLNEALLCERLLQEKDGMLTIVRVVDKITVSPPPGPEPAPTQMQPFLASLTLVVGLKAGAARGTYTLTVRPQDPDGADLEGNDISISFSGADDAQGITTIVNMNLGIQHDGLYWFNILLNGELISRVPLRIEYQPVQDAQLQAPAAPANSE